MPDIAGVLPSYVIADLMGIPLEDGRRIYALTEKMHSAHEAVNEQERAAAGMEMLGYALNLMEEKRKHPGDDIATKLLNAEVDGDRLTPSEYSFFFLLLINAGGDTTRNLLGGGMLALFNHPDQRRRLQANLDALLPTAVEEMLRYVSPVIYMRRTAMSDTELGGKQIASGRQSGDVSMARRIATRACFPRPTSSTSRARPTSTSHSVAARISVWARTSRGSKFR